MASCDETVKNTIEDEGTPSSLQEDVNAFVPKCIRAYEARHRVTILEHELETESMVGAGRNNASGVLRLNLVNKDPADGREFRTSIVLKVPQMSGRYVVCKNFRMYEREMYMYKIVLPRIYQFWSRHEKLTPEFYVSSSSEMLALENLLESGFALRKKDRTLDRTECEVALKTLARFHALSVKYLHTTGEGQQGHPTIFSFAGQRDDIIALFAPVLDKIKRYAIPRLSEGELDKWARFERDNDTLVENVYATYDANTFNVICHGDLHGNNLFLLDDKCALIDFQISHVSSPVVDLIKFLVSNVQFDMFERHRDTILDQYLATLNRTLKEVGCTCRYTRSELNDDFARYQFFVVSCLCTLPILWSGRSSWSAAGENELDDVIKSERFVSVFKDWLGVLQ